jgi:hypothetical protein
MDMESEYYLMFNYKSIDLGKRIWQ